MEKIQSTIKPSFSTDPNYCPNIFNSLEQDA